MSTMCSVGYWAQNRSVLSIGTILVWYVLYWLSHQELANQLKGSLACSSPVLALQCSLLWKLPCCQPACKMSALTAPSVGKFAPFQSSNRRSPCARSVRTAALQVNRPTLIDVPVSNHGARVRHVIYHKGIEGDFDIVSPMAYGGLGSEQYKSINPLNKMPLLLMPDGLKLPESEIIVQFILDKWSASGPSMQAPTANLRAVQNLAARIHDQYITPIQGCMYRKFDAAERASLLEQLNKQLDNLEGVCVGPYIAGPEITTGDSALLPTFVFFTYILPKYFGWKDVFAGRPKLAAWWQHMQQNSHAQRVIEEVTGGLDSWSSKNRWEELGITHQLKTNPQHKWAYP